MTRGPRLLTLLTIAGTVATQDPELTTIERAADAVIESFAPEEDDPQSQVMRLIDAAETVRATEIGSALLSDVDSRLPGPNDLVAILARLDRFKLDEATGEVAHEIDILRTKLFGYLARYDAIAKSTVFDGYASQATVLGPFGDDGDHYVGVPFPPEKTFPGPDVELAGRYGPIRSRRVSRRWDRFRITLTDPLRGRDGCFFVLHQVELDRETPAYLRVFVGGSFELFLNGTRIATKDAALDDHRSPVHVPVVLRKGHNQVLIKTCQNRIRWIGLRYSDRHGYPLKNLREFKHAPKVEPPSTTTATGKPPAPFAHAASMLESAARNQVGDRRARLLLAAAITTGSTREGHRLIDAVLQTPPRSPRLRLALAHLLRRVPSLPSTYRRERARRIVEDIGDALGDHHTVFTHRIDHLEDEDKREAAVRLLRRRIAAGKGGPDTFQRLSTLYQQLDFWAEYRRLETAWIKAWPRDMRPVLSAIGFHTSSADYIGALRLARSALDRLPGHRTLLRHLLTRSAEMGDEQTARNAIAKLHARLPPDSLGYLKDRATLAQRLGDRTGYLDLLETIAVHPDASLSTIRATSGKLLTGGRTAVAKKLFEKVLAADPSDMPLRRRLWRLNGEPEFPNLERFRVDIAPILQSFKPTAREDSASSSLLLDHMIVEVFEDGSSVHEVHTLRRINDQRGVESHASADDSANADELVLLRTIGTDGKSYVPNLVDDEFHMPRLAPGAFIEAIYRTYHEPSAPGPQRITRFYFQNNAAPFLRSEIVVILPKDHKSTIRLRNFPNRPTVTELPSGKTAYGYRVDGSPRLPTEFSPPPIEDIVPILACGQDGGYAGQRRRYRQGALTGCFVTPPIQRQADRLVSGLRTDREKAEAIHAFVHKEIVEARSSSIPTTVLLDKKGPRFWLELALLSAAKVPYRHGLSAPRRKETRRRAEPFYRGEIPYSVPCARVEPRDGESFWLFVGLPRYYPMGAIPANRFRAEVMLVDPMERLLLPDGEIRAGIGLHATGTLEIDEAGNGVLAVEVEVRGEAGFSLAEMLRNQVASRQQRFARDIVGGLLRGWSLSGAIELVNLDANAPLTLRATLRRRQALKPAGDDYLLPLPMPPTELLSTWGGRAERTLPLQLTGENAMYWRVTVDPGAAFEVVETPTDTRTNTMLIDYALSYERSAGKTTITRDFLQRAGRVEPEQFDEWRALLKTLDDAESRNLRLRRKK